jgi:hypothetical protein
MGMFDLIVVEEGVDLPIPEEMLGLKLEFQTKCLDNTLSTYLIAKDNFFYLINSIGENSYIKEKSKNKLDSFLNLKRINLHEVIDFGSYIQTDLVDYSANYEAKFTDGVLQYIKLVEYKKIEHESRKEKLKKLEKQRKQQYNLFHKKLARTIRSHLNPVFDYFGIDSKNLEFCYPKFLLFYKNNSRGDSDDKNYGFFVEDLSTGIKLNKTKYSSRLTYKFLGFGFSYRKMKPWDTIE